MLQFFTLRCQHNLFILAKNTYPAVNLQYPFRGKTKKLHTLTKVDTGVL